MTVLESVKERFKKVTGWARPSVRDLDAALRPRKANACLGLIEAKSCEHFVIGGDLHPRRPCLGLIEAQ